MQTTGSTYLNENRSDTTQGKELMSQQPSSFQHSNRSNEKSLVMGNSMLTKLERSLESSVTMLEKAVEGIDAGTDPETGSDQISMDNIDAAHKLIDMAVKIIAVKERLARS